MALETKHQHWYISYPVSLRQFASLSVLPGNVWSEGREGDTCEGHRRANPAAAWGCSGLDGLVFFPFSLFLCAKNPKPLYAH